MNRSTTARRTSAAIAVTAAVFTVGMAGSATAAKLITGADIKNGTVTTQDVKNNNLGGADIRTGSLKGADLKDGSVAEADLAAPARAKLNAPAVSGYEVRTTTVEVESAGLVTAFVSCTAGKVALTGGGEWENLDVDPVISGSVPQKVIRGDSELFAPADPGFADGWRIDGAHNGLDPQDLTAYVICVSP